MYINCPLVIITTFEVGGIIISTIIISPFYRWRNCGTDNLSNIPKITKLVSEEAWFYNQGIWLQGLCLIYPKCQ